MTKNPLRSSAGFTYVAAIVMVVIMGIMLSKAALVWTTRMQRERETDLIFRGTQVRNAMRSWYNVRLVDGKLVPSLAPGGGPAVPRPDLSELKQLLNGSGTDSATKTHFLRPSNLKVIDPLTGKEKDWELYKAAGAAKVSGVFLKSEGAPLKQDNFPFDLSPEDFKGKKKYSDWVFVYDHFPPAAGTTGGAKGIPPPGTGGPGSGGSTPTTSGGTGNNPGATP